MPEHMKPYTLTAFLFLLIAYLGVQALTGERGLLSGGEREALLHLRASQLAALEAERADLEVRSRYLRVGSLSKDLLEERARAVLGFADPRDYVVQTAGPVVKSGSPATS